MNQTRSGDTKSLDYASLCNQTKRRRICAKQFRPTAFAFSSQSVFLSRQLSTERLLGNHLLSNQFSGRCFTSFVTDRHQKLQTRWKDPRIQIGFFTPAEIKKPVFFVSQANKSRCCKCVSALSTMAQLDAAKRSWDTSLPCSKGDQSPLLEV